MEGLENMALQNDLGAVVIKQEIDIVDNDFKEENQDFGPIFDEMDTYTWKVEIKQEIVDQVEVKVEMDQTSVLAGTWKVELKREPKIEILFRTQKIDCKKSKPSRPRPSKIKLMQDIKPMMKNQRRSQSFKAKTNTSVSAFEIWSNWDESVDNSNPTRCELCKKIFGHSQNLKVHLYTHMTSEEKQIVETSWEFVCYFCSKRFRAPSILEMHAISHTRERPFKCRVTGCGKTYTRKSSLNVHIRAHSKDLSVRRPVSCKLCGQLFTVKSHLSIHLKYHQGLKEHKCPYCDIRFTHKSNVTVHVNNMHKRIRYKCRWCDVTYGQKSAIAWHEKTKCIARKGLNQNKNN